MKRALVLATVTAVSLLGLVPGAQADLRVSSNFRLNSDPNAFRAKDQIGMAVDPGNSQHIVAVHANYLTENCEATTSTDGGATWSQAVALLPPTGESTPGANDPFQPTCRISNHLGETMFQNIKFGTGQNVYATSIDPRICPTPPGACTNEQGSAILVYKSTDGGQTWARGVIAVPGGPTASGGPYHELPTVNVDPGAGTGSADRVVVAARETTAAGGTGGDARVAVSNDGAATFGPATDADPPGEDIAGPDSTSQPVIGSDHSIGIAWRTSGITGEIHFARSTNGGATWSAPVVVTQVVNQARSSADHITPMPSTGSSFPRLAIDKGNGNLYIVYNQAGPPTNPGGPTCPSPVPCPAGYAGADHFISPDSDVYFQRSLDNGATWSNPKLLNDAGAKPGVPITQTRHPDVSVAPNGRVDVVWQDRRHWFQGPTGPGLAETNHDCIHTHVNCDEARLGDTYYAFSTNQGASFSPTGGKRISDRSLNNDVGFDYRFGAYWGFGPVAVPQGNSGLLIGWMDSREGSFDNDNQDIYLAKVDHSGSSTIAQGSITRSSDVDQFSVDLSKGTWPGGGEGTLAATFATKNSTRPVIVNEAEVPKVLAGGVLARANLGPVLLSPASGLPASVKSEVARLNPAGAFVIGDTNSLSAQVVTDLNNNVAPGGTVTRIPGANDAAIAKAIAVAMDRRTAAEKTANLPAFDAAVIVNPTSPDASAVAGLAAARRLPVLFTSPDGQTLPPETTSAFALGDLAINKTLVIGNSSVVSNTVAAGLPSPTRLGGADQYETSKAVVNESRTRGLPENVVYVADGANPMDGALLGSTVGRATGLELLVPAALGSNAPGAISDLNLTSQVDHLLLVQPASGGGGGTTTGGGGLTSSGTNTAAADKVAPGVSNYGLTNNPFVVGGRTPTFGTAAARKKRHKKGTTFRYTLSEAATARIVITQNRAGRRKGRRCVAPTRKLRRARKCTRTFFKGTLTRVSHVGRNSVGFSGRIGAKALTPGTYRATLTATDAANNTSKPKTISFTIVKR
jgi:putative cell wall-binding protein